MASVNKMTAPRVGVSHTITETVLRVRDTEHNFAQAQYTAEVVRSLRGTGETTEASPQSVTLILCPNNSITATVPKHLSFKQKQKVQSN